jgi:muconolactone delta-isomerase
MLILVLCRPAADADQAEFRRLVPAETAALRELKDNGALSCAWSPGHPGAVLMLDVADEAEAARLTARLPLTRAGLITTEIIPLHPIDLLPARSGKPSPKVPTRAIWPALVTASLKVETELRRRHSFII